jgi:hypothetical protein
LKHVFHVPNDFDVACTKWYGSALKIDEEELAKVIRSFVSKNHHLSKSLFLDLARWKSSRPLRHAGRNEERDVVEITGVALRAKSERFRIGSLLSLDGVSWPMASVILHFCHEDPYPILDVRVLSTLGLQKLPTYGFAFWSTYVNFSRTLAAEYNVTMRQLDRRAQTTYSMSGHARFELWT